MSNQKLNDMIVKICDIKCHTIFENMIMSLKNFTRIIMSWLVLLAIKMSP